MRPTCSLALLVFIATTLNVEANPNCINNTECPVWPTQFSSPFTLYGNVPSIKNASSMFYYKYLSGAPNSTQAQLVDYVDRCLPFVNIKSALKAIPCKLLFINSGIYLHQPKHDIDCCRFVKDVGAVPPAFLKAYTYKGTNISAPDMYGNNVMCDQWDGPQGFQYWTVSHYDKLYKNWGHDILFKDGPTGVTWRWGNFNVTEQPDELFQLFSDPATCSKSCTKFLTEEERAEMERHIAKYLVR